MTTLLFFSSRWLCSCSSFTHGTAHCFRVDSRCGGCISQFRGKSVNSYFPQETINGLLSPWSQCRNRATGAPLWAPLPSGGGCHCSPQVVSCTGLRDGPGCSCCSLTLSFVTFKAAPFHIPTSTPYRLEAQDFSSQIIMHLALGFQCQFWSLQSEKVLFLCPFCTLKAVT